MIFNEGDKIVCIEPKFYGEMSLELYKIYTVDTNILFNFRDIEITGLFLHGVNDICSKERFITMEEFRKLKINEILK
jgi:hypothetical protein